jgi:DNA-binding transcriptional ArsR family regulator
MAIVYRFGHEDLLRTRFAISPLMELNGSVEALRDPERFAVHVPWSDWARPRAADLDMSLLHVLVPRDPPFYPDFLSPPPLVPAADLDGELERVRRTPHDQVALELHKAYPDGDIPAAGLILLERPQRGLDLLVAQMRAYWDAVLAEHWPAIRGVLEAEIAWRARRLAAEGPGTAFSGIHESVRWRDDRIEVRARWRPRVVDLAGRGLLLVPAVFAWPIVWPMSDPPWQPALVYAPPGVANLWEPVDTAADALAKLLGRGRARVLLGLERPASTLELSNRMGASPAAISEHLGILRRAGLAVPRREGRQVLYARTSLGDELAGAATAPPRPPPS